MLHLEHTSIHNSSSLPVEMKGCEDVRFKHHAVFEFLIAKKIPAIDIYHRMQAVYGDKCVDVGYGSLTFILRPLNYSSCSRYGVFLVTAL